MNIFVTGVSSGIGRELVKQLVKEGHKVWGVARRADQLQKLQKEVRKNHFFYSVCDVGRENDVKETIQDLKNHSFIPDVVILNAAVYIEDSKTNYNHASLSKTFGINVLGALSWVEKFLPDFLLKGNGQFIAISSTSAYRPDANSVSLPSSKAALSMAMRSLRLRYNAQNIIFSTIHFGPVATTLSPKYLSQNNGPKYPFVLAVSQAAGNIQKVIKERKSKDYFFPFFATFVFRLTLILPDSFFAIVSKLLKR